VIGMGPRPHVERDASKPALLRSNAYPAIRSNGDSLRTSAIGDGGAMARKHSRIVAHNRTLHPCLGCGPEVREK
jgi:hypothetical protein